MDHYSALRMWLDNYHTETYPADMKPTSPLFALPLVAFSFGGLLLTGCAVQQPTGKRASKNLFVSVAQDQSDSASTTSRLAIRKKAKHTADPEPQSAAEPAPEPKPQAAAEPAPEPKPQAPAAPKRRGPLTPAEENEIDNQAMP